MKEDIVMGLLDGLKKKAAEVAPETKAIPEAEYEPAEIKWHRPEEDKTDGLTRIVQPVNMTDKNVKVDVPDDEGLYVSGVYLWEEDGMVRGLKGDEVIFEVTKRSKAYKELEPYFKHKSAGTTIYKRHGDYGDYYRVLVKFDVVLDD